MSRSGYNDDYGCDDQWGLIRWRGAVASAFRGARGQAFLREIIKAFDALPEKILVASELEKDGSYCTLGTVGWMRGVDMTEIDSEDYDNAGPAFGIASAMAREIMYENDECGPGNETPEARYIRMRIFVESHLIEWEKT